MICLLRKEWRLAMHPTAPAFLAFSAMLLIPSYPYLVVFFYTGLAVFFTCMTGRENQDVTFSMLLPIRREDVVKGRFLFTILLEAVQMLTAVIMAVVRAKLIPMSNGAGMEANVALFGLALGMFGVFHSVFFPMYYKDVRKVGKAFVWASTAIFGYITVETVCAHAVPFVRDVLDTPDPQNMPAKLAVLALGMAVYLLLTWSAFKRSKKAFERLSL